MQKVYQKAKNQRYWPSKTNLDFPEENILYYIFLNILGYKGEGAAPRPLQKKITNEEGVIMYILQEL